MLTLFLAGEVNAQREDNYMKFISHWKTFVTVAEPQKLGRIDGETKQGKRLEFFDSFAETEDQDVIEKVMKSPSFGIDFWIFDEGKKSTFVPSHTPTVEKMPAEKEANEHAEKKDEEIQGLKNSINQLTVIVQGLIEQKAKTKPGRKPKEKITNEEESKEE